MDADWTVESAAVWAATIKDEPGGLAAKLVPLAEAGANLNFMIARRCPDKPGTGVLFVAPLAGQAVEAAAEKLGFAETTSLYAIRVTGPNGPGVGGQITRTLAEAGINLRGITALVVGETFVMHFAVDTGSDAEKAISLLQ